MARLFVPASLLSLFALSLSSTAASTAQHAAACTALSHRISELIPGHAVYNVVNQLLPANSSFLNGTFDYATPVRALPELCQFGAYFNTSAKSSVKFEVWMPTTTWNGRFAFVGNGIAAGGVNYPDMGGAVSNYGFAVASTDTGHEAPGLIGTFAVNNTESVIDFGHRAVHLSTVFAKNVVRAFYGARPHKSYWIGCSSGGKQGLKEAQAYPGDYDGVVAGSPAWYWSHLSAWTIQSALLNPQGPGYVSFAAFATLHASIIRQCDALDGLQDGIVTNPAVCHIDWAATGLTTAQQVQAAKQYQNWTSPLTGKLIFPAYSLGAEETGLAGAATGSFPFTEDYYKYEVLNYTSITNYTFTSDKLAKLVQVADATNPGGTTANDFDMSPFFNRGGKLLHYVGTQDAIIPYGSSILYYESVRRALGDVSHAYRMFPVPGMGHCAGGSRTPSDFNGSPGSSGTAPNTMDPFGNAIVAMMNWVEKGIAPDAIVGVGSNFSRPLCQYPKFGYYRGHGNTSDASSFVCR